MIGQLYRKTWRVVSGSFWLLLGLSCLALVLMDLGLVLGGAVLGIGVAAVILVHTAMQRIFLRSYRAEEIGCLQLFECFRDWKTIKRVLCGVGWMLLWRMLWSAIPIAGIIFGIIRGYEYSLVPYILVEDPQVSPTQALEISKEKTKGWKGKMFGADLLYGTAVVLILLILALLSTNWEVGAIFAVLFVIALVAVLLIVPLFAGVLRAAFYERIMHPADEAEFKDRFCGACGAPVRDGTVFCVNCGKKL